MRDLKVYQGGPGICVESGSPVFRDCIITDCRAVCSDIDCVDTRGGAIHVTLGSPVFEQCIIARNHAEEPLSLS